MHTHVRSTGASPVNVLVLGMHLADGASAVASALRAAGLFGWDAGSENPTQPDNPNGYAERIDVVGLDNRMLAALMDLG